MTAKSPSRAKREERYINKLSPEQKAYVVRRLASYHTPTEIQRDLKELFGIEISVQAVNHYHADRIGYDNLAPCWKELFWETRKAFIAACAQAGTMEQMVRVRLREDMVLMARDAGHYRIANELLNSIAKEAGQMFVNRSILEVAPGAASTVRAARIVYQYDDGERVIVPGDPGGASIILRRAGKMNEVAPLPPPAEPAG
jgi:hypothetical protein